MSRSGCVSSARDVCTPSTTLFPYTTLFRSGFFGTRLLRAQECFVQLQQGAQAVCRAGGIGDQLRSAGRPPARLDRKSTRLNSSHTVISYAVFCLKKKKKISSHRNTKPTLQI